MPALVPNAGWLVVAVGEVSDRPYPSKISAWNTSLNRSSTATGSDAPPETHSRSSGSWSALAAASSSPMYIVGTPWKTVTFSRTIRSIAASPVNRASSTSVPPSRNVPFMPTVWPNVWNSGRQPITTSSERSVVGVEAR